MRSTIRPTIRPTTRRSFLAGTSALALAPLLAACGDETTSPPEDAPSGSAAEPEAAAGFPVEIETRFGPVIIDEVPQRVVVAGLVEQDMLLALGFVPVAVSNWFGDAPGRIFSWATDALGDAALPTVLDPTAAGFNEEVLRLQPDLVVALYSDLNQKQFDLFTDNGAKVIARTDEYADYSVPWDESTLTIGKALGQPEKARQLVDDVLAQVEQARADHPEFEGKTAICVTPYEGLFVYGPEDPRGRILADLGFTFPEALRDGGTEAFGYSLSVEQTAKLDDVDVVVWLDYDGAPAGMKQLFEGTAAFAEGRYFSISDEDGDYYIGQSFVTPLSIPYVLERYVPQIAAAVDGDPATEVPAAD